MNCERLNNILKKRFDIDLLVEPLDRDHLESVYEHYRDQRVLLRSQSLMENTIEYTKAYLISEAARVILREIAPKRRKKKKGA